MSWMIGFLKMCGRCFLRSLFFLSLAVFVPVVVMAEDGVYKKNNQHDFPFMFGLCMSDENVVTQCNGMEHFEGVAGKQVTFTKVLDSMRFVVQVEPNWKGQVIVRRGFKSDVNYLGRSLPYAELSVGDKTTLNVDFTPCRKNAGDCIRYDYGKTLIDYSGVYEVRVLNGKIPVRSALILLVFAREDDHVQSQIRLFNRGQELHDGTNKGANCKWFWCSSPTISFVAPYTSESVWTERDGVLFKKYTKVDSYKRLVATTSGTFEMEKKGEYVTKFIDNQGRMGSVVVGRR